MKKKIDYKKNKFNLKKTHQIHKLCNLSYLDNPANHANFIYRQNKKKKIINLNSQPAQY